jgi:BCD family chlorophyll transporter-like MFS transporter
VLNLVALWKQEARNPAEHRAPTATLVRPRFRDSLCAYRAGVKPTAALAVAVGLGTMAFSMQDILLEPYGGGRS